jgi:hypothetical protein
VQEGEERKVAKMTAKAVDTRMLNDDELEQNWEAEGVEVAPDDDDVVSLGSDDELDDDDVELVGVMKRGRDDDGEQDEDETMDGKAEDDGSKASKPKKQKSMEVCYFLFLLIGLND